MISSQNFASAAPKKNVKRAAANKASTKRAAVGGKKNTKRAAVSGNNKRAATSKRRVMSRSKISTPVVNKATEAEVESKETEEAVEEVAVAYAACPVEKVIAARANDNGDFEYYNGNDKCSEPENSLPYKWKSDLKSKYPRGSIKESEAYYFKCADNYMVKTVNKERVCVSVLNTCPLGVVLEKADDGYLSPETGEVCSLAANSQARLANDGENDRGDVDDSAAYIAECNANKYSAPLDGVESGLHLQCLSCPAGWEAPVGAKSESECVDVEMEKKLKEEKEKAEEVFASMQAEDKRLATLRIMKVDASSDNYTCIHGWTNHWDFGSDGVLFEAKIMDKDGVIKNVVDRERFGKNRVGCPIKSGDILTLEGIEHMMGPDLVMSATATSKILGVVNKHLPPKFGLLRKKMVASDIDNTGVNGWTDEEYAKWDNYKPVIGVYYSDPGAEYKYPFYYLKWKGSQHNISKVKEGGDNSESNLFTYFD